MKRLVILSILLSVVACFAATNELQYLGFHVEPRTLANYSHYDYSHGAYNGFPMRIQPESVSSQGIYFTFMAQPQGSIRKQRWAYFDLDGNMVDEGQVTPQTSFQEGFGTIAIDPRNGNAHFAWHAVLNKYDESATEISDPNTFFTWDAFDWMSAPNNIAAPALLIDNTLADEELREIYIWPVVHMGPSPFPDKVRLYVFKYNQAMSRMKNTDGVNYVQSSDMLISFADIAIDQHDSNPSEDIWIRRNVPYLKDSHNWESEEFWAAIKVSTAVAPEGPYAGTIAIGGNLRMRGDAWMFREDLGKHDHIILINRNYLELEDENDEEAKRNLFDEYPLKLAEIVENPAPLRFDPALVSSASPEDKELIDWLYEEHALFQENPEPPVISRGYRPFDLGMTTMTLDNRGRLHMPLQFANIYNKVGDELGSFWWTWLSFSVRMLNFDINTGKVVRQFPISPYVEEGSNPFPWALTEGYVDMPREDWIGSYYQALFPYNYFQREGTTQHTGHIRTTLEHNGIIATMFFDGTKAAIHNEYADDYPEYYQTPEINISISIDSGASWSKPFSLSKHTPNTPNLGTIPAYLYPADRVIQVAPNIVRLYFMYTDDLHWGPAAVVSGLEFGSLVKFAAIDFDVSELVNTEDDVIPRPTDSVNLSQNYPNPFNPTTTIKFNVPVSGNTKVNVYNLRGQLVKTLVDEHLNAGSHSVTWEGLDNNNRNVASGVYFYKLETGAVSETKRMVLMK